MKREKETQQDDEKLAEFAWCLHCEKAQLWAKVVKNHYCCTIPGCGAGPFDMIPWETEAMPRSNHPEYPEKPEVGETYPLYL